ncbi:MAG: dTDP-4-dehydrorhamnose 3,5-epimerase family protein [Pseudomonadota bacterium]
MSERFTIDPTAIEGVVTVERHPIGDHRGSLERLYDHEVFAALGFARPPVQINRTVTRKDGTVRGLHFQRAPALEAKLVQCLSGAIFDVAVDLRAGSPMFGRWVGKVLSAENRLGLLIPEGCAHGFQTLESDTELLYLHTAPYAPRAEDGVHHASENIGIAWPRPVAMVSDRDAALTPFGQDTVPVELDKTP